VSDPLVDRQVRRRLAVLRHAEEVTGNVALTCRYFGISRQLYYTWPPSSDSPPQLVALFGVGVELVGQFLVTAGDNPERISNEAAFAKLCGAAPQPASSGRTTGLHVSRAPGAPAGRAIVWPPIARPLARGRSTGRGSGAPYP